MSGNHFYRRVFVSIDLPKIELSEGDEDANNVFFVVPIFNSHGSAEGKM